MSGNAARSRPKIDRRVRRTRDRLGDALIELICEKPFDAVRVRDVLARAGVGRSTFYAHFRDKNDLFLSDVEEFLESTATLLERRGERSDRVLPIREFFAHVAQAERLRASLVASGRIHDFNELARGHFARGIERRLAGNPRARCLAASRRSPTAHALAGALLSLMTWWLDRGTRESPEEMDAFFHGLVWNGVAAEAEKAGKRPGS